MLYREFAIAAIDRTIAAASSSGLVDHPGLKGRLREIVIEDLLKAIFEPSN